MLKLQLTVHGTDLRVVEDDRELRKDLVATVLVTARGWADAEQSALDLLRRDLRRSIAPEQPSPPALRVGRMCRVTSFVGLPARTFAWSLHLADKPQPEGPAFRIGDHEFALPAWWDEIEVDLPQDIHTEADMRGLVTGLLGADTGTRETWRSALKAWALFFAREGGLPVYVGHCWSAGGEHDMALRTYSRLLELAPGEGPHAGWYRVLLSDRTAREYVALERHADACRWFERVIAAAREARGPAADYYAKIARERLDTIGSWP